MTNKAYSIHVGVNRLDPYEYDGWNGSLSACEADALAMFNIAVEHKKYEESILLLTEEATKKKFEEKLNAISAMALAGDFVLLTFSGHGGQVKDKSGDEKDGLDETWCFYDGQIIDDKINELLSAFKPGVRVLVISDSCFSGDIVRGDDMFSGGKEIVNLKGVKASVILIASCREKEYSKGYAHQGVFTLKLLEVWNEGKFSGDYQEFYQLIFSKMPYGKGQNPTMVISDQIDCDFLSSEVFTIPKLARMVERIVNAN